MLMDDLRRARSDARREGWGRSGETPHGGEDSSLVLFFSPSFTSSLSPGVVVVTAGATGLFADAGCVGGVCLAADPLKQQGRRGMQERSRDERVTEPNTDDILDHSRMAATGYGF